MKLTGSQIFVEVLVEQGVDTLFGYPGGAVLNLYDELYKNSDRIRHVLTAHEQGASHAADGYARATGPYRRCAGHQRPGCDEPCHRHCHGLHGQRADGRLHRQCRHDAAG